MKWYKDGLKFECKCCGYCCTFEGGYVWVFMDEITDMANSLNISLEEFGKKYLRNVSGDYSLIEKPDGQCIMYEKTGCKVYNARPVQCRTFPFWPENLKTKKDWENLKKTCPGLDAGDYYSFEEIEKSAE